MNDSQPVPDGVGSGRLTCGYYLRAREHPDEASAQCGGRVVLQVGETLAFCETHANGVLALPVATQRDLRCRHVA